jgi:hypothetical protein
MKPRTAQRTYLATDISADKTVDKKVSKLWFFQYPPRLLIMGSTGKTEGAEQVGSARIQRTEEKGCRIR